MYPKPVTATTNLTADQAVVLIGLAGAGVEYLQFLHSSMPAINLYHRADVGIVAFPVPVGLKQLSLQTYVPAGGGAGYVGSMSFGYRNAKTPPVDIDKPGIYYLGTLYPAERRVTPEPVAAQLTAARETYKAVFEGREPVNFSWPTP